MKSNTPPSADPGEPSHSDRTLSRALDYPYARPDRCYLFHNSSVKPASGRDSYREGRTPILAYGSNRAPEQLHRKFGDLPQREAILVEMCDISGWDVVHSAHVTSYGAIPAALHEAEDVSVKVAVTWLSGKQLEIMDKSEHAGQNYGREHLGRTALLADGASIDEVQAYKTIHGPLFFDNRIASHADIEARGRINRAFTNAELLRYAHAEFDSERCFEVFLLQLAGNPLFRNSVTEKLKTGLYGQTD